METVNEINTIANSLKQFEWVSFDVFDTLLSRPFKQPTDLFLLIEKEKGAPGFAAERTKAEQRARKEHKNQADVTLDQIYDTIVRQYKNLKEDELKYEYDLLYPKPEGMTLYEAAVSQGKKIVATSDMYLPSDFITKVLKKNGYTAISHVIVSNEENCCKGNGKLFEKLLKKLNIEPAKIIHIGDNLISDKKAPEELGIASCHRISDTEKLYDDHVPFNETFKVFASKNELDTSVIIGINAYHRANGISNDPLREIGYFLGGPLAVGYVMHIDKTARKRGNDGLLFVSRDGYALHKVYNRIVSNPISNYYIQASRKLILRNSIDYQEKVYTENVLKMYADECLNGKPVPLKDFGLYKEDMREWAKRNSQNYTKYVDSLNISGNKLMTIDMTTREYTSLKLLTKVLGKRIDCGMFSVSFGESSNHLTALSYAKMNWQAGDEPIIMLQEQMITAPDFSVYAIKEDGAYVYANKHPLEQLRIENYKRILEGVLDFANDYKHLFGNHQIPFSFEHWWENAKILIRTAKGSDKQPFKIIFHDDSVRDMFDSLYDILFSGKKGQIPEVKDGLVQQLIKDNTYLNGKNKKHLKWIRILIAIIFIESIILLTLQLL